MFHQGFLPIYYHTSFYIHCRLIHQQWGNNNTAYIQTNFPMQFPNKLFVVLLSLYSNPGSRDTGSNIETYEHRHSGEQIKLDQKILYLLIFHLRKQLEYQRFQMFYQLIHYLHVYNLLMTLLLLIELFQMLEIQMEKIKMDYMCNGLLLVLNYLPKEK